MKKVRWSELQSVGATERNPGGVNETLGLL